MYKYKIDNKIIGFEKKLDKSIYGYAELTPSEYAFIVTNPTANYEEVTNLKMQKSIIQDVPLSDLKKIKIEELNTLSFTTAGKLSPAYKRENAAISMHILHLIEQGKIPAQETRCTLEECIDIEREANRIAILCTKESVRVSNLILSAQSELDVNVAFMNNKFKDIK